VVCRKGQRTNKHREAEHPFAVDIPVVGNGLGQNLNLIHAAADECAGGAEVWGHRATGERGMLADWVRVGTKTLADAERMAGLFSHLDARRVR
jgi:hypothetical protein